METKLMGYIISLSNRMEQEIIEENNDAQEVTIQSLPPEILSHIFKYLFNYKESPLSLQALLDVRLVCKLWKEVSSEHTFPQIYANTHDYVFTHPFFSHIPGLKNTLEKAQAKNQQFLRDKIRVPNDLVPFHLLSNVVKSNSILVLPYQYEKRHQKLQNLCLKKIWLRIKDQLTFEADTPSSSQSIRDWINDKANADQIERIRELNLSSLSLQLLPPEIGKFINLDSLHLEINQLATLPESIGKLQRLTTLDLSFNRLTTLPDNIGELQNLKFFDLYENNLTTLPETIANLIEMEKLDLSSNKLNTLPHNIGNLLNLKELRLCNNQLNSLPHNIGNLLNLKELRLCNNQLNTLPYTIGNLGMLEQLHVSKNQLKTLPHTIVDLQELFRLNLFQNQLETLPDAFGNLPKQYGELYLGNNPLKALPRSIENLQRQHWRVNLYTPCYE